MPEAPKRYRPSMPRRLLGCFLHGLKVLGAQPNNPICVWIHLDLQQPAPHPALQGRACAYRSSAGCFGLWQVLQPMPKQQHCSTQVW